MIRKPGLASICALLSVVFFNSPCAGAQADSGLRSFPRITQGISDSSRVALTGNVRPEARPENDRGRVADALPMEHMLLQLKRSPGQETALQQFIDELQTAGLTEFSSLDHRAGIRPAIRRHASGSASPHRLARIARLAGQRRLSERHGHRFFRHRRPGAQGLPNGDSSPHSKR